MNLPPFNIYTANSMLYIIFLICFPLVVYAVELEDKTAYEQFYLGYQPQHFHYDEPALMNETGWMHGVVGSYTRYDIKNCAWVRFNGNLSFGTLHYDGALSDGTPIQSGTDDHLYSLEALAGSYLYYKQGTIHWYSGIGTRYWNDTIEGTGGYEREIRYLYLPIGAELNFLAGNGNNIGLKLQYNILIRGWVESWLSQVNSGFSNAQNEQRAGSGYAVKLTANYGVNIFGISTVWEPFIEYWEVQDSDSTVITYHGLPYMVGVEPHNRTISTGINIKVQI